MKRMFALLLCLLTLAVQAAPDRVSPEEFTQEFRAAIAASLPGHTVSVREPLQVSIKGADGEEGTAFLDNAYSEYSRDPSGKADVIARYVASFVETVKGSRPVNPELIVPVIKDRGWLKEMRRAAGGAKAVDGQVIEELNQDLVIVYAEDGPQNIRYFSAQELEKAGVQRDKLRELAIANLRRILPHIETVNGPLVSMLAAGGDYVPSLLLFDELWSGSNLAVDGEIVVAVPTRGVLLFTGSRNKDGVRKLRELAKKAAADGPYSLTDRLFVYRGGKFERF